MPRCPCPAQALLNTLAARLCAKRKMMAMGRDAKGSARGTARADWLLCSEQRQKRSDERRRKCHPIHPFARRTPHMPTPPTPTSHTNYHPKLAHTHTLTQNTKNPNLHYYHLALFNQPKISTTLRLPFLHFPFLSACLPRRFRKAQNFVSALRKGILSPSLSLFPCVVFFLDFVVRSQKHLSPGKMRGAVLFN